MSLKRLTSPLLSPINHGFYTRLGGASSGIFEGLNCGTGSSDQAEIVQINRSRVAEDMGGDLSDLVTVYQTHSATALTIASTGNPETAADAMVCASPNITLAVLTADCQPVLFADPNAKIIGAAHAGWRGALNGVLVGILLHIATTILFETSDGHEFNGRKFLTVILGLAMSLMTTHIH